MDNTYLFQENRYKYISTTQFSETNMKQTFVGLVK